MPQTGCFIHQMDRKKHVGSKYNPNTYRIISCQAEEIVPRPMMDARGDIPNINIMGQPPAKYRPNNIHRQNRPNATHVGFLRDDVRLLMGPVCDVHTALTASEQGAWWPSRISKEPLQLPPQTKNTTMRGDYDYRGDDMDDDVHTRHGVGQSKSETALGVVPVNFLRYPRQEPSLYREGISYEHQFNSRGDAAYPVRGKRHGSFVWDDMSPNMVDRMLSKYGYISDELGGLNSSTALAYSRQMSGTEAQRKSSPPMTSPLGASPKPGSSTRRRVSPKTLPVATVQSQGESSSDSNQTVVTVTSSRHVSQKGDENMAESSITLPEVDT